MVPPSKWAALSILGLLLLLPALFFVGAGLSTRGFPSQPAAYYILPFFLVIAALLIALMQRRSVSLEAGGLVIRATLYTQRIPLGDLDLDAASVTDLREHREHLPRWKTNGFGTFGMLAGHFRGQGMRKQFVLLTDRSRVLLLPQRSGRLILLSFVHPHEALKALRQAANRHD